MSCSCCCVTVTCQSHRKWLIVRSVVLFALYLEVPREARRSFCGHCRAPVPPRGEQAALLPSAGCSDQWAPPVLLKKGETSDRASSFCTSSSGPLTSALSPWCLIRIDFRIGNFCQHVFLTESEINCYNDRMCNSNPTARYARTWFMRFSSIFVLIVPS